MAHMMNRRKVGNSIERACGKHPKRGQSYSHLFYIKVAAIIKKDSSPQDIPTNVHLFHNRICG